VLGVSITELTASKAMAKNSQMMHQVITAMRNIDIADADIATTTFTLRPQYSRGQRTKRQLTGFEVTQLVKITLDSVRVSELLDTAVTAGANQINTITFNLPRETQQTLEAEARRNAVADARAKADLIAASLGVNIIGVVSAIEGRAPRPPGLARSMSAVSESPPIAVPSETAVSVSLNVTYLIE
jgi:uncharacterized protein YggE